MRLLYLGSADTLADVRDELREFDVRRAVDDDAVDRELAGADVILDASMRFPLTADRLARATKLKVIVTATTGADHIDETTLTQRGIPLLTLRGCRDVLNQVTPAAEHAWALLLACARRLPAAARSVCDGAWERADYPGVMLRGRTLGVVGCGRLGQRVARYATAFDMSVCGCDPHVRPWPNAIERCELPELLERSDFVSLHVPLTDETRTLIDADGFRRIKPGAILINTSRGDVIDEAALLEALRGGRVAAAGLDVLTGEPKIAKHPLVAFAREHPQLIITPHIGGNSPDAVRLVLRFSCRRIREWFGAPACVTASNS
ncbi:MAG: NAD(P)-dependent oxidoreductase [Phycisphaerae bacterium]